MLSDPPLTINLVLEEPRESTPSTDPRLLTIIPAFIVRVTAPPAKGFAPIETSNPLKVVVLLIESSAISITLYSSKENTFAFISAKAFSMEV